MKNLIQIIVITGFVSIASMPAWAVDQFVVDTAGTQITFSAESTLHPIHGTDYSLDGSIEVDSVKDSYQIKGNVFIDVDQLNTKNPKRDKNMKVMLDESHFPKIVCRIDSLKVNRFIEGQDNEAQLNGALTIAGHEKPLTVKVLLTRTKDQWLIKGSHIVSLAEYQLHPPSVLGLIRVQDKVLVNFVVAFRSPNVSQ